MNGVGTITQQPPSRGLRESRPRSRPRKVEVPEGFGVGSTVLYTPPQQAINSMRSVRGIEAPVWPEARRDEARGMNGAARNTSVDKKGVALGLRNVLYLFYSCPWDRTHWATLRLDIFG